MFLDQSREFKNLEQLFISYRSDNQLSYFDSLIDNCAQLKKLTLGLCPTGAKRIVTEVGASIYPSPKIQKLTCTFNTINNEIQLRYVMQKFPNLRRIDIQNDIYRTNICTLCFPIHVAIDLSRFVMTIPSFKIVIPLRRQNLEKVWILS